MTQAPLDGIDPREIPVRLALEMTRHTAEVLVGHEAALRELVVKAEQLHSIGIVVDPTFYRETLWNDRYKANVQVAKDVLAFIAAARTWVKAHGAELGADAVEADEARADG